MRLRDWYTNTNKTNSSLKELVGGGGGTDNVKQKRLCCVDIFSMGPEKVRVVVLEGLTCLRSSGKYIVVSN